MNSCLKPKSPYQHTNFAAFLLAISLLAGRWNFGRIFDIGNSQEIDPRSISYLLIFEIRLWSIIALILLTFFKAPLRRNFSFPSSSAAGAATSLGLLFFWLTISGIWTNEGSLAEYKIYEIMISMALFSCLLIWTTSAQGYFFCQACWQMIVVVSFMLVSISIPQVLASAARQSGERLAILGGGPNVFGRYVCICLMACIFSKWRISVRIPIVGFLIVTLILTGSRGAFLSFAVALVMCSPLLLSGLFRNKWILPSLGTGIILAGLASTVIAPQVFSYGLLVFEQRFVEKTYRQGYTSMRTELFSTSLEMIKEKPIFGYGLSGWGETLGQPYPHNLFLEVMIDSGVIGLVLLAAFLLYLAAMAIKYARAGTLRWHWLSLAAIMFTSAQFSGDLFDSRTFFAFSLLIILPTNSLIHPALQTKSISSEKKSNRNFGGNIYAMET